MTKKHAKKYERKMEKILAFLKIIVYTKQCCDIDSVEAGGGCRYGRFSVERMSSYETGDKSLYTSNIYKVETTCGQTGRLSEELLAFDGAEKFLFMGKSS